MLKSLDRYILRCELTAFTAAISLVALILTLENVPRIWTAVSQTAAPLWLLRQMALALMPEYLGIGILIASFIAPAWVIRTMALRGEWQTLSASGLSPWRIMSAPLLLATASAGGELVLRLAIEPSAEQIFDELGSGLDNGTFGIPIALRQFVGLDDKTTIYLMPSHQPGRHFGQTFMRRGKDVFSAASANARRDLSGRIEIELFDGQQIGPNDEGKDRILDFATFRFTYSPSIVAAQVLAPSDRLNRLPLGSLLDGTRREISAGASSRPIMASLLARISSALFCLLLPWMAYVLAQPPRRERSGAGFALGIGLLVLFLRTNSLVERDCLHWPLTAAAAHFALWAAATAALVRFGMTREPGFIDRVINNIGRVLISSWKRHRDLFAVRRRAGSLRTSRHRVRTGL